MLVAESTGRVLTDGPEQRRILSPVLLLPLSAWSSTSVSLFVLLSLYYPLRFCYFLN